MAVLEESRGAANDAARKNDISNIYKSIVGKQTINGITYPSVVSTIEEGKTNTDLQSFINQFLSTTPVTSLLLLPIHHLLLLLL